MKAVKRNLFEVYVWQLPVRFFHWINALCLVILCVTGYVIGDPPAISQGGEAIYHYWMGWVRLIHLITAMVFVVNALVRIYWAFVGNRFSRWYNYIPITKSQWVGIYNTVKVDVFLLSKNAVYDIGHNSLAATTYFIMFFAFIIQVITGFMMMFVTTNNVLEPVTTWALFKVDGFYWIRYIHHAMMWIFIMFAIIHIYLVFYHDYIERNGIASSIIGGWKFIPADLAEEDENEQDQEAVLKQEKEDIKAREKEVKHARKEEEVVNSGDR